MPGPSVSACHLCHLHGHTSNDNLVRTSPLRHSRAISRSSSRQSSRSSHRHFHGHQNGGGYSSSIEDGIRQVSRSNSSSALARLTDNPHSLPGSRSNSLTRYHRGVSILPDGGEVYVRGVKTNVRTRSLDVNPPIKVLLEAPRVPSLQRILTPVHLKPKIHAPPDILASAMPRSRSNSRSGSVPRESLPRNPVAMSQDNSQDYYLDMHRQRAKEETRKHRFNLQTVMLIGCYTLLVMIAIVVGVVLCYQNGWFGLGSSQINSSVLPDDSNAIHRAPQDIENRQMHPDEDTSIDSRIRFREIENVNKNFDPSLINNPRLGSGFSSNVNRQTPRRNENDFDDKRDRTNQNLNSNQGQPTGGSRSIPSVRVDNSPDTLNERRSNVQRTNQQGDQEVFINHPTDPRFRQNIPNEFGNDLPTRRTASHPSQTPVSNTGNTNREETTIQSNRPRVIHGRFFSGISPSQNINTGEKQDQQPNTDDQSRAQSENQPRRLVNSFDSSIPFFQGGVPSNRSPVSNLPKVFVNHPIHPSLLPNTPNFRINENLNIPSSTRSQDATDPNTSSNIRFAHDGSPITNISPPRIPINRVHFNGNSNIPTTLITGLPPNRSNLNKGGFQIVGNEEINRSNDNSQLSATDNNFPAIRTGNLAANTIAKNLLKTSDHRSLQHSSNPSREGKTIITHESNNDDSNRNAGKLLSILTNKKFLSEDTSGLTTQELLDILAIRRMRDLLNSKGNTISILELLHITDPTKSSSSSTPVGTINTPLTTDTLTKVETNSKTEGRSISDTNNNNANNNNNNNNNANNNNRHFFQLQELIAALKNSGRNQTRMRPNENIRNSFQNFQNAQENPSESQNRQLSSVQEDDDSINTLINKTIDGALIRLIRNRVNGRKDRIDEPPLNLNISGVSVFPLSSEELKILLESNPVSINENFGTVTLENLRSLEILHRLIRMNMQLSEAKTQSPSNSVTRNQNFSPSVQRNRSNFGPTSSNIGSRIPIPQALIQVDEDPSNIAIVIAKEILKDITDSPETTPHPSEPPDQVPKSINHAFVISSDADKLQFPSRVISIPKQLLKEESDIMNSSFALMVKTNEEPVPSPTPIPKPVFPPPFQTTKVNRTTSAEIDLAPARMGVPTQMGRRRSRKSRGKGNSDVVRTWTHMDSSGTFSKGVVQSDGSFAFTNCRPIELCTDKKDN